MSCGRAWPVAKCSKSTSNLESSFSPFASTSRSRTRYGTFPSRFESSELLTYSRLLSGVSFIICACGMATVLTSFGCIGSATSYCCTAPPPNSDTNRNLLSYEIRMSAGSEPSDMRISYDNKFLFVSLFGGGAVQQYDVADPMQPKLVSTVAIPQAQMMKLTPDNKRLYVSNS